MNIHITLSYVTINEKFINKILIFMKTTQITEKKKVMHDFDISMTNLCLDL